MPRLRVPLKKIIKKKRCSFGNQFLSSLQTVDWSCFWIPGLGVASGFVPVKQKSENTGCALWELFQSCSSECSPQICSQPLISRCLRHYEKQEKYDRSLSLRLSPKVENYLNMQIQHHEEGLKTHSTQINLIVYNNSETDFDPQHIH